MSFRKLGMHESSEEPRVELLPALVGCTRIASVMIKPVPPAARAERYAAFLSVGKLLMPKFVVCPGRNTRFLILTPPISMGVSTFDISFGS